MNTNSLSAFRISLCAVFIFGIFGWVQAQTPIYDWYDTAPDGNWKQGAQGARWTGGLWDQPPAGNELRFNNNSQVVMNNNVTGYSVNKITFGSSATNNRVISGNGLTFFDFSGIWPRVDNLSNAQHTIGFPIIIGLNSTVWDLEFATNNSGTGKIVLNSSATILNNNSKFIYVYGNGTTNSNRYVEFDGVISGNGKLQIKLGGIARIGALHTYTGATTIEHGELWIDAGGDLSTTTVINLGTTIPASSLASVAKIHISDMDGGTTFSRNIIVQNGNTSTRYLGGINSSGTNTFSGTINRQLNTNDLSLESTSINGTVAFSGVINGSGNVIKVGAGIVVLSASNTYTGLTLVNGGTLRLNNTGGNTLPSSNSIEVNSGGTLRISSNQTLANLTINPGGTVIVDPNVQLTVDGVLTNNGTFTMESGATFKQGTSIAGTGTFNVKQSITGGNNGTAPNGRFWYMGVPMSGLTKGAAFGSVTGPQETKVWQFIETAASGWGSPLSSSIGLQEARGYTVRSGESNPTFTFSGNNLFSTDTTISLSYTSGFGNGFHLLCNSYMAPLSWEQIHAASINLSPTYWVRSYNGSSQALIFDTYNATSNESVITSGGTTNQYIAPLQSFWVKALPNVSNRSLTMERAMTSHQPANVLKSSIDFPVYARVNLVDDSKFDQALIYMNQNISSAFDDYDSEKMFVAGMAQIYTQVSTKKLVMNGLKNNKKKISIPLYLDLPTSKVYQLQLNEYNMEDGLIILEDKLEGTMQDFTINDTYAFYANSGVLANRFVLHFFMPDATITAQGPSNTWVDEEITINEGGSITVSSNGRGKVTINQDIDTTATEKGAVIVRDASGREVYNGQLEGTQTSIQIDAPSGVYFVEVSVQGEVEVKKIFIQE